MEAPLEAVELIEDGRKPNLTYAFFAIIYLKITYKKIDDILKVFDCGGILFTDEVSEINIKYERWCT